MYFYAKQEIQADVEEIDTENNPDVETKTACTMLELLRLPEVWRPLLVACALQVIQQLSGINAVRTSRGARRSRSAPTLKSIIVITCTCMYIDIVFVRV